MDVWNYLGLSKFGRTRLGAEDASLGENELHTLGDAQQNSHFAGGLTAHFARSLGIWMWTALAAS